MGGREAGREGEARDEMRGVWPDQEALVDHCEDEKGARGRMSRSRVVAGTLNGLNAPEASGQLHFRPPAVPSDSLDDLVLCLLLDEMPCKSLHSSCHLRGEKKKKKRTQGTFISSKRRHFSKSELQTSLKVNTLHPFMPPRVGISVYLLGATI